MALKIATGNKKGITLNSTKAVKELRPSTSLVREAIIQILENLNFSFAEANILDLYSGMGTVGFEFLSNGVQNITFIEKDTRCVKILRDNIRNLSFSKNAKVLAKPVVDGLKQLAKSNSEQAEFDLIFADPPYKLHDFDLVSQEILSKKLLKKSGIFVWECSAQDRIVTDHSNTNQGLELIKEKKYGDTLIYFFKSQ